MGCHALLQVQSPSSFLRLVCAPSPRGLRLHCSPPVLSPAPGMSSHHGGWRSWARAVRQGPAELGRPGTAGQTSEAPVGWRKAAAVLCPWAFCPTENSSAHPQIFCFLFRGLHPFITPVLALGYCCRHQKKPWKRCAVLCLVAQLYLALCPPWLLSAPWHFPRPAGGVGHRLT